MIVLRCLSLIVNFYVFCNIYWSKCWKHLSIIFDQLCKNGKKKNIIALN